MRKLEGRIAMLEEDLHRAKLVRAEKMNRQEVYEQEIADLMDTRARRMKDSKKDRLAAMARMSQAAQQ
jgi:hypothetical protein